LRDRPVRDPADRAVSSCSVGLDRATGPGGLPRGHLTEYLGPESSGKTTLLYAALAATQRASGLVARIDTEGSADSATLAACGVDLDRLIIARPTSARDALLLLTILARCGGLDALGLSSIAALRDLPSGSHTPGPITREALETWRNVSRPIPDASYGKGAPSPRQCARKVLCSVADLPQEDRFDAATCIFVLHFLPDAEKLALLRGIAGRLHPAAPVLVGTAARVVGAGEDGGLRDDFLGAWQQHGELLGVPAAQMAAMITQASALQPMMATPEGHVALLHAAGFAEVGEVLRVMNGGISAWIAR